MNFIEKLFNLFKDYFRFTSGNGGSFKLDNSYTGTAMFKVIAFTEESVVNYTDELSGQVIASLSVPAGFQIYGNLVNVTLTSGIALGYLK
jgi:hypothetical protein